MPHTKAGKAFTKMLLEVFRLNGLLLAAGDRLTEPLGLSSARWQVLGAIEDGPLSVAQIARNMGLARQSVQRIADILEKERFIEYAPNPDHKRAHLVCLTRSGTVVMKELGQLQIEWANRIAKATSAVEIETALSVVARLRLQLESEPSS